MTRDEAKQLRPGDSFIDAGGRRWTVTANNPWSKDTADPHVLVTLNNPDETIGATHVRAVFLYAQLEPFVRT